MYVTVDDCTRLFTATAGSGEIPLVALHGGLGLDHATMLDALAPLGDVFRIIAYDQRGNGRSTYPADWQSVDDRVWAEDLHRLCSSLRLDAPVILASSYSCHIALEHARTHPTALRGLVLVGGEASTEHDAAAFATVSRLATTDQMCALQQLFAPDSQLEDEAFRTAIVTLLPLYFGGPVPAEVVRLFQESVVYSPAAFRRAYFGCRPGYDVTQKLQEVAVPVLVVQGGGDWITPPGACGELLARLLPHAQYLLIEDAGHFPFLEADPKAFQSGLRSWAATLA